MLSPACAGEGAGARALAFTSVGFEDTARSDAQALAGLHDCSITPRSEPLAAEKTKT